MHVRRSLPFPLTARFVALDAVFWTTVSALFAIQATSRGDVAFGIAFRGSFVSFVPCILLTPAIALLSDQFRFGEATRLRSSLAHLAGLVGFLTIGGGMMGLFDWLTWTPRTASAWPAISGAVLRYLAFDVIIYVLVMTAT